MSSPRRAAGEPFRFPAVLARGPKRPGLARPARLAAGLLLALVTLRPGPAWAAGAEPAPLAAEETCSNGAPAASHSGRSAALDSVQVSIPVLGAPSRGAPDAKVTIVEFSDFQCPSCAAASRWVDSIATAYPRDVRIVFKQYPLSFHEHAGEAAEASLAAADQGKFWELLAKIYGHQSELDRAALLGWACEIGVDLRAFAKGLFEGRYHARVAIDVADGDRLGIRGTPSVFVDGRAYLGRRLMSDVRPVLDSLLAVRGAAPRRPASGTRPRAWTAPRSAAGSTAAPLPH